MIIKSKKFVLRKYRKGDEQALRKNINNRRVAMYMSSVPHPYTIKNAKEWLAKDLKWQKEKKPTEVNFAIDIDGEVVGAVGFSGVKWEHKAEIGYWLAEKHWRQGIMTEAVRLVVKFGFKELKLKRIFATVFFPNLASKRVLEKADFKLEGVMRKHHKKNGRIYDSWLLAKVKKN